MRIVVVGYFEFIQGLFAISALSQRSLRLNLSAKGTKEAQWTQRKYLRPKEPTARIVTLQAVTTWLSRQKLHLQLFQMVKQMSRVITDEEFESVRTIHPLIGLTSGINIANNNHKLSVVLRPQFGKIAPCVTVIVAGLHPQFLFITRESGQVALL